MYLLQCQKVNVTKTFTQQSRACIDKKIFVQTDLLITSQNLFSKQPFFIKMKPKSVGNFGGLDL